MNEREKVKKIQDLLNEADVIGTDPAEFLFKNGVEPRVSARWMKDDTYVGKNKDMFICSECLHWQSVKKVEPDQVMYMKYCPFCGAKMEV